MEICPKCKRLSWMYRPMSEVWACLYFNCLYAEKQPVEIACLRMRINELEAENERLAGELLKYITPPNDVLLQMAERCEPPRDLPEDDDERPW